MAYFQHRILNHIQISPSSYRFPSRHGFMKDSLETPPYIERFTPNRLLCLLYTTLRLQAPSVSPEMCCTAVYQPSGRTGQCQGHGAQLQGIGKLRQPLTWCLFIKCAKSIFFACSFYGQRQRAGQTFLALFSLLLMSVEDSRFVRTRGYVLQAKWWGFLSFHSWPLTGAVKARVHTFSL